MNTTDLPKGYECHRCGGTGLSLRTAEPISTLPSFQPKPLPCSDCSRRALGIPEGRDRYSPYTIWWAKT